MLCFGALESRDAVLSPLLGWDGKLPTSILE